MSKSKVTVESEIEWPKEVTSCPICGGVIEGGSECPNGCDDPDDNNPY